MIDPRASESEIHGHALHSAGLVKACLYGIGKHSGAPTDAAMLTGRLNAIARACHAQPVAEEKTLSGRIARMTNAPWWKRNVRRELVRENEVIEHAQGALRRRGQVYVSDYAVTAKAKRQKVNRETLQALEVVNENFEALNLLEVSDASVSNPKLRRAELMTRCRGFEEIAQYMKHEAVFLTLTCPSRFHRFDGNGKENKKWAGQTPRDGQKYLVDLWAKIRSAWNKAGFTPYGFRVAEPHHDGCPHWHILLFAPPETLGWFKPRRFIADRDDSGAGLVGIAGQYALADNPGEAGAMKHRFTVKHIDPSKGSATGYIAKYICKNIDGEKEDGEAMGMDFASGKKATEASQRVRVWASVWGIRQFQQIGGPSVTVWREMRKLAKDGQPLQLSLFEGPRAAADRALWSLFWLLQGGPDVPRSKLTLKPLYSREMSQQYGDFQNKVFGVSGVDRFNEISAAGGEFAIQTRLHTWTIQRSGLNASNLEYFDRLDTMARERAVSAFLLDAGVSALDFAAKSGAIASPWTGVNNCTDNEEPGMTEAEKADYDRTFGTIRGGGGAKPESLTHETRNFEPFESGGGISH